jgi:hypothetical protein
MGVSASSVVSAQIGPPQNIATVTVDISSTGPNNAATGNAVASVSVSTAGVPVAGPTSGQLPAGLGPLGSTASLSVANSRLTSVAGGTGATSTAITSTASVQITAGTSVQMMEIFNLAASPIWASWTSTAPSTGNGSFPIPALATFTAGYYAAPPGGSGTLTLYSTAASAAYTCNLWS